ncbi:MAG: flagellar biosynthesis anti-sigma factor FlgM [Treponema sp.]|nr:flagellar biosynthesis anti-sigma factor FlgM [Treponema sp.]
MMIDRVSQLSSVQMDSKAGKADQVRGDGTLDSIDVSNKARDLAEIYQATELAKASETLDGARILALQAQINDPAYVNAKIAATADRILDSFGL